MLLITLYFGNAGMAQKSLRIVNRLAQTRTDELIILQRADIDKKPGNNEGAFLVVKDQKGNLVTLQQDDLDGDGRWDEAVFLYTFLPGQKRWFTVTYNKEKAAINEVARAHVRMMHKRGDDSFGASVVRDTMPFNNPPTDFGRTKLPFYLTEGPGWENDKVAFRQYFDLRNTRDIYGKRVSGMVMDTVGANPKSSYHQLSNWGMDILHVVRSLGAGSAAIAIRDKNNKDTLIRLGGKDIQKQIFEQVADGPVRAIFRMHYQWRINDRPVTVTEETSIWGGQYFYETKTSITGVPADSWLVTGIADFYQNKVDSIVTPAAAILLSHGDQSENKDALGMAALVPGKSFAGFKEAPKAGSDITETHLVAQQIKEGQPTRYRFYVCWEKTDPHFISGDYFKKFMEEQERQFGSDLKLTWK